MAQTKKLLAVEEKKSLREVADFLRQIADSLDNSRITLSYGDQEVNLDLPNTVEMDIDVEEEPGPRGSEMSFEVEIEWDEGQPQGELEVK